MITEAKQTTNKKLVTENAIFTSDDIPPASSVTKNKAWMFIYPKRDKGSRHNYYMIRWTDKNGKVHNEYLGTAKEIYRWKQVLKGKKEND